MSIPHRAQFTPSSSGHGNKRANTDSEEALLPPFLSTNNSDQTDTMNHLQQLTMRQQILQPPCITSTLVKPKPRTGITGYFQIHYFVQLVYFLYG